MGPHSFLKLETQFSYLISSAKHGPVVNASHMVEKLGTTP